MVEQAQRAGHYGWNAINRSLGHFAAGKTVRMVCSLTIFFVLVRTLPVAEYAAYVSFQALILAIGILTSIGIQKVLFRFLPELRATGNHIGAYRLLLGGMFLRTTIVSMLFVLIWLAVPFIARTFHLEEWAWLLPWYLVMGYLRLTALWLSQCLESFLWQRESQYSLAAGSVVTLSLLLYWASNGELGLERVVFAEIAGEATSLSLLLVGWLAKWWKDPQRREGDAGWWRANRRRAIRYGLWSYVLSQSELFYGSAPNRLVAARFLGTADVAVLGAADNLRNQIKKFIPTRMFMSIVRPVAMARFSDGENFRSVTAISEFVFRLNISLLALPIAVLAVVGPELMALLTNGKYPAAGYLLMGFLIVMVVEGFRDLVALMVQAIEKNSLLVWTNLVQACFLLLAIPFLPELGLWSLVLANFAGTVTANSLVIFWLRRLGYQVVIRWALVSRVFVAGVAAASIGWLILQTTASPAGAALAVVFTYAGIWALWPPLLEKERKLLSSAVSKRFPLKRVAA